MIGVWTELRSSLRQLHRSMIPQSTQGLGHRSRPSLTRIKALANMYVLNNSLILYISDISRISLPEDIVLNMYLLVEKMFEKVDKAFFSYV